MWINEKNVENLLFVRNYAHVSTVNFWLNYASFLFFPQFSTGVEKLLFNTVDELWITCIIFKGNFMYKIAFFDIDGTLYSHKTNEIPASVFPSLQQLQDHDVKIYLCSGRAPAEMEDFPVFKTLPVNGEVYMNGALVLSGEKLISSLPINPENIPKAVEYIDEHPLPVLFIEKDKMYMNIINETVRHVQRLIDSSLPPVEDIHQALHHDVYMMIPYGKEQEVGPFLQLLSDIKTHVWGDFSAVDINHKDADKANGMKRVLDYYGYTPEECIAFGDGLNDISMIQYAGLGIAVGGAEKEVKDAADYVCDEIEKDGIQKALLHFELI